MIQVQRQQAPPGVLHAVRVAHATRRSADQRKCGGDFIAYAIGDNCFTLTIGDAAAKGDHGRRIARLLRRSFCEAAHTASAARILTAMSEALVRHVGDRVPTPDFAAALVVTIDLRWGVLSYAAAGVEGGLLFGKRSPHVHLGSTGPLLGIHERPQFEEQAMRFLPGDVLVAYTDGVTEARGRPGAPPFGSSGLVRSMRELHPGEPSIRALWNKIGKYTGRVYHDDATLAIVTAASASSR